MPAAIDARLRRPMCLPRGVRCSLATKQWLPRPGGVRSALKGTHMLRFLSAGMVTVGGLLLLFLGSFADPGSTLRDLG